jgi:hypothetical protein
MGVTLMVPRQNVFIERVCAGAYICCNWQGMMIQTAQQHQKPVDRQSRGVCTGKLMHTDYNPAQAICQLTDGISHQTKTVKISIRHMQRRGHKMHCNVQICIAHNNS